LLPTRDFSQLQKCKKIQLIKTWLTLFLCCMYRAFYHEYINTFTAKVDHGRFKYLRFNLPASTLVDLKSTLLFCLK
jgi:hypothetical protein